MKKKKGQDEPEADNEDLDFAGATEEMPQFEDSEDDSETEAHPTMVLDETAAVEPPGGGDTEDVFVILPEGEGGDIPMVDTEAVDEIDGTRTEAVPMQSMDSLADIPLRRSNPLLGDTQEVDEQAVQENLEPEEGAEDLEQMASDMDDEILRAPSRVAARDDDLLEDAGGEASSAAAGHQAAAPAPRARSGLKAVFALAAMALFAAGGYYAYITWYIPSLGTGASGSSLGSAALGGPGGIDRGSALPAGVDTGVASTIPVEPELAEGAQAASRSAFREKLLLAVELGFGGEVSNE